MGTHNIRFHGEIRTILCGYPLLSVAMTVHILVALRVNECTRFSCQFAKGDNVCRHEAASLIMEAFRNWGVLL